MTHVNVLLLKQLKGHGDEGKVVRVKAGFARNFLVPKGWAIPEFRANKKQIEALCKAREVREAKELEEAKALAKTEIKPNSILVFGSESDGISQELLDKSDGAFYIEQLGSTRSINVGCASAVAMYEAVRQLGLLPKDA